MAGVAVTRPQEISTQPRNGTDFDFNQSVGEIGYQGDAPEDESLGDAALGRETEALLKDMRRAITEQGLRGDEYKAPDLMRFLRARSNNIKKASKLFVDHERFRASFCPKGYISEDEVQNELAARKACLQGKDKHGQPLSLTVTKNHDAGKRDLEEFKRFIVHCLDKIIAAMPPGVEKFVALLDLTDISYANWINMPSDTSLTSFKATIQSGWRSSTS